MDSSRSRDPDGALHVVLGASGGVGGAVVRELVARGHRVRAVNRGGDADVPGGVERLAADVSTRQGAKDAAAGGAVVYHAAQPAYHRWAEEFPPMNEAVIAGTAAARAKLVFADNLYMHGPVDGSITEDTPERATSRKGRVRAALAERLREAHRSGTVRTTMGRAADYYGPGGVDSGAGEMLFTAVLRGRTATWPASLDQPHAFSYLDDVAAGLVTLGERDEADGRAWLLPVAEPVTARQFIGMVHAAAGEPPNGPRTGPARARAVPLPLMRLAGLVVPPAREIPDIWDQFARPFTVDASRFARTFGPARVTPYREGIARTVAWFRDRPAARRP